MKNNLLIIFCFLLFASQMVYAQDYFEGKVTYDISYEPIHPNATVEFLEENYGVKEILYYKKGHYKKIRLNRLNDTISILVYSPKKNTTYGTHISVRDTLMVYGSDDNIMLSYKEKNLGKVSVNDFETYSIQYVFDYKQEFDLGGNKKSEKTYCFSENFPIKHKWHKNQKDGFYNKIIKKNPYLILKVVDNDFYIKIETKVAVSVERIKVDKNTFNIDSSLPVKHI